MDASMGAQSQSAAGATANNFGATASSAGHNETKQLETGIKESMTLIDRFYNGGNRARPAALDILVVVLDGVVRCSSRNGALSPAADEVAHNFAFISGAANRGRFTQLGARPADASCGPSAVREVPSSADLAVVVAVPNFKRKNACSENQFE